VDRSSAVVLLRVNDNGTVPLDHGGAALLEAALDESVGRAPLGRGPGGGLGHHLVDLLEGETLCLGDEEVGVDEGDGAEAAPDEEDGRLEVTLVGADHVGGDDGDDGVPEPVGGGGEGDTARADGKGEDLADEDPGTGTPGGGEEEDEDGDEGDLGVDGGDVVGARGAVGEGGGVVETLSHTDDSDQELADEHTERTDEEECAATELLHSVEGERGGADVDEGEDERDQEGVADGAGRLQEGSGVVEDEVDTGPLLHHLERGTEDSLAEVGVGLEEGSLEAVGPARDPATGGDKLALVLLVGNDFSKLKLNHGPELSRLGVGGVDTTDLHQSLLGLIGTAALDKVTRGVREAGNTTTEDKTPGELDTNGDAVLASVTTTLDAIVDTGSKQETNGDAELVTGDEGTADLLGANLGHVENDNGRLETDTNTGNSTTSNEEVATTGSHLHDDSYEGVSGWFHRVVQGELLYR
jgi:hypothetical protein